MFDSGVGGLTVLHAVLVRLPHEDVVYLGDTGRFPYGPRTHDELIAYGRELTGILVERGAKMIVVACNSATAAALPVLQRESPVPVLGVVTPEARAAVRATRSRKVGVLATEATVSSGCYVEAIHDFDAGIEVTQVACPGLAEAIQSGEPYSERTLQLVRAAADPLRKAGVDVVVLGCTHYPLIRHMLQRELGVDIQTITGAEALAEEVAGLLARMGREGSRDHRGTYRFLATGDVDAFREQGTRFLQLPIAEVEFVAVG